MKRQKVKGDESLGPSLEDEAIEVQHLLAEPKTENVSVDSLLSFGGLDFINTRGQDDFEFGVLDGLLDEVDEVDDIHAANDISGACENLLLDLELTKGTGLFFVKSERFRLGNSSSESQSPGFSGCSNGALQSESSSAIALESDCKNVSLEKTVKCDLLVSSSGKRKCQAGVDNGLHFTSHNLEYLEEVCDDVKPLANSIAYDDNKRKAVQATKCSLHIRQKRMRRPTKRYIEEFSITKLKHDKGSQNACFTASEDKNLKNDASDDLDQVTAICASKEESCSEVIPPTTEDSEVSLNEKLLDMIKRRRLPSAASKDKCLKIISQNEPPHVMELEPTSREESCAANVAQEPPRRRRGRPKKSRPQIAKSDHECSGSDSDNDYVKRWKSKKHKSKYHDDRRKHQRMWTPSEVMKLTDGIAQYGTGRWTDIKNHLFSSSAYRTPIDLRDKWRNLLKASCTYKQKRKQNKKEEVEEKVKNAMHSLPKSLLHRISELATIHPYPRFSPGGRYIRSKN